MNCLLIDTSDNQKVIVGLKIQDKEFKREQVVEKSRVQAQAVLPLIDSVLLEHKLQLSDIHSIEVHTGPGSFTGVRVGVSIANTLSYTLKVPVNGKKVGELVEPSYS